jgi:uncharacterized protein YkwD
MKRKLAQLGMPLVMTGLLGAPLASSATAADPPLEAQLLALVNADRRGNGLPALVVSAGLTQAAQAWSDHELAVGTIEHDPYPGVFLSPSWLAWGEDVGVGPSPSVVNAMFMASAPHRDNILGQYNRIGVGVSRRSDGSEFVDVEFEQVSGP